MGRVDDSTDSEEMRPIVLHVTQIQYDVDLRHQYKKRIAVVHLELSEVMIKDLIKNLTRMVADNKVRGSARVSFKGNMVLE